MKDRGDLTPDVFADSLTSSQIAEGRLAPNLDDTNINGYIASLTALAHIPLIHPYSRDKYTKVTGMLAYLRDGFEAQTVGDAKRVLEQRRVDPGIVGLWVDEEMATMLVDSSILTGYPELEEAMGDAKARATAKLGFSE